MNIVNLILRIIPFVGDFIEKKHDKTSYTPAGTLDVPFLIISIIRNVILGVLIWNFIKNGDIDGAVELFKEVD